MIRKKLKKSVKMFLKRWLILIIVIEVVLHFGASVAVVAIDRDPGVLFSDQFLDVYKTDWRGGLSLIVMSFISAIVLSLFRLLRDKPKCLGPECEMCGYLLVGLDGVGVCPECGGDIMGIEFGN